MHTGPEGATGAPGSSETKRRCGPRRTAKSFISPRTERGGAASVRSRPPRDAAGRGGWGPALHRSVLGIEDAPLPAGEAPGVGGGRRRRFRGAPAGSLDAGLTGGARTHAGTRTAQSPAGPGGQPHSLTLRDGLRLLLGASGHHPLSALPASAAAAPPASQARPSPGACLPSSAGNPPASGRAAPSLAPFTFPPPENCRQARPASGSYNVAKRKYEASRTPGPGRSACEGVGSNAPQPAVTEELRGDRGLRRR